MVQVDVFWTYGIGAGFAMAASRQLKAEAEAEQRGDGGGLLASEFFSRNLLFLAALFAPSGVCLLWAFPSWETMHVGDRNLPAWLVTAFAVTNITQGVLGYWVTQRLVIAGKPYLAFLQTAAGYFMLFFILVHGWDGTGYQRFFSYTKDDFLSWSLWNIPAWLVSPVALTLYFFGLFILPLIFMWSAKWIKEGYELAADVDQEKALIISPKWIMQRLGIFYGGLLASAITASIIIHIFGWLFGLAAFAAAAFALCLRKGGIFHRLYQGIFLPDSSAHKTQGESTTFSTDDIDQRTIAGV